MLHQYYFIFQTIYQCIHFLHLILVYLSKYISRLTCIKEGLLFYLFALLYIRSVISQQYLYQGFHRQYINNSMLYVHPHALELYRKAIQNLTNTHFSFINNCWKCVLMKHKKKVFLSQITIEKTKSKIRQEHFLGHLLCWTLFSYNR